MATLGPYYLGPTDDLAGGIYNRDALQFVQELPPNSVDAYVTDPPYCSGGFTETAKRHAKGQGLRSENLRKMDWFVNDNMTTAGLTFLLRSIALEAHRTLKDGGSLCVFTDWRMVSHIAPAIESSGLRFQNIVIWDKGSMGLGWGFRPQHEMIMHFVKGVGAFYSKTVGNVIQARRAPSQQRDNPTEKPIDLMTQILSVVVPPGGVVVDPFMGGGPTAVAAKQLGMRYLGAEINAGQASRARERVRNTQPPLLVPQAEQLPLEAVARKPVSTAAKPSRSTSTTPATAPPPGSPDAIARGCLCPRIDNRNGLGAFDDDDGHPLYWTRDDCPLHGSGSGWRAGDESEEGEE